MQHFDGARLSPNSVLNAVWLALNEPVCLYLRTRNPRCSTVYIDNSLGPLARESPWGPEINHSHPCSTEVKSEWSYIYIPIYAFMEWTYKTLDLALHRHINTFLHSFTDTSKILGHVPRNSPNIQFSCKTLGQGRDRDSSVGRATRYGLDGLEIESRWGRDFPHLSRPALGPTQPPIKSVPGLSHLWPRLKKA